MAPLERFKLRKMFTSIDDLCYFASNINYNLFIDWFIYVLIDINNTVNINFGFTEGLTRSDDDPREYCRLTLCFTT